MTQFISTYKGHDPHSFFFKDVKELTRTDITVLPIKEDKESTENERQGVVTEKEVTGRISGKQKPVSPSLNLPKDAAHP